MADIAIIPPDPTVDPPPPPEVLVDRLSDLPDPLLITILSLLPTHHAFQTSGLSRRFRGLWSASPTLHFYRSYFRVTARFVKLVNRALLSRDCSAPLETLSIKTNSFGSRILLPLTSAALWIDHAAYLGVKHLRLMLESPTTAELCRNIFSIRSLESLHIELSNFLGNKLLEQVFAEIHLRRYIAFMPPDVVSMRLKYLYFELNMDSADLTRLVRGLPVLEYLELTGIYQSIIDISSLSVKTLKLECGYSKMVKLCFPNLDFVYLCCKMSNLEMFQGEMPLVTNAVFSLSSCDVTMLALKSMLESAANVVEMELYIMKTCLRCEMQLCFPRLECLKFSCNTSFLKLFQAKMPVLRKADIKFFYATEEFAQPVSSFLKCIANAVYLKLTIQDHWVQMKPFHILDSNNKRPLFPRLINLELSTCCHEATIEDVISLLENCPVLNCLKMSHMDPNISENQDKRKKDWQSKLPRNSEGNYQRACFTDLHIIEKKSNVINLLSRKLSSKKRKIG